MSDPSARSAKEKGGGTKSVDGAGLDQRRDAAGFRAAWDTLRSNDLIRLDKKAAIRALGTGKDGRDLLNEAVLRTLDGRREWPAGVPVTVYLDNAMRSIADEARKELARERPAGDGHDPGSVIGNYADPGPSVEARVYARLELEAVVERLEARLSGDAQALAVLIGEMEGWSAAELLELEPMNANDYAAARKRLRRAVEREFGKGARQ